MQVYNQSAKNSRTRGTITPKAKKIFKELFSSGFTQTEIAKEYNVPVGTVGSIVKPSRKKAKTVVKPNYNPDAVAFTPVNHSITLLENEKTKLLVRVKAIETAIEVLRGK